jgi:thymidylate synthase (FAD)
VLSLVVITSCKRKGSSLDKIDVGNNGYVRLLDIFGDELTIVNAARASFAKEKTELDESDIRLIGFLVKHKHDSVFRHNVMSFEVKCPLEVKNQWWKHVIASTQIDDQYGWNESSRRYVTEEPDFFMPAVFKQAPDNNKQGRGTEDHPYSEEWRAELARTQQEGLLKYHNAINSGVAPEQARLFLPAYGMNVTFRWTASLQAILNFLTLRLGEGAQKEISDFGRAVEVFVATCFPYTYQAWKEHRL